LVAGKWVEPGYSYYFRLNENDKTVFREVGRESDFMQWLSPTLQARPKLKQLLSTVDRSRESLEKFDQYITIV